MLVQITNDVILKPDTDQMLLISDVTWYKPFVIVNKMYLQTCKDANGL